MVDTSRTRPITMPNDHDWREVPKSEFYAAVGPLDVHPSIRGKYPYTMDWKTPGGFIRGISVEYIPEGEGLPKTKYFLPR